MATRSKAESGRDLIKKIKPLLSSQPIMSAKMNLEINGIGRLTVEYIVTKEMLEALASQVPPSE